METSGFYKLENGAILFAPNFVEAPDYRLDVAQKDTYTYPVSGWYWFASEEIAKANLSAFFKPFADKLTELEGVTTAVVDTLNEKNIL